MANLMTDLLSRPTARTSPARPTAGRSPAVAAALGGLAAAGLVLAACLALALVGWFASDAGSHGTTRDALRVGTDAWLMAHGGSLRLSTDAATATITAVPLGLTAWCLYVAYRCGRRAARGCAVEDATTLGSAVFVFAGTYAVVALLGAVLASTATAEVSLMRSFAGGFAVALLGGGLGLTRGACVVEWRERVPETLRAIGLGSLAVAVAMVALGSLFLAVALLLDLGAAANVLSRLRTDWSGGLFYTLFTAAVAPNAVLLAESYLLGPGFAVGTGTVVSPAAVELGPVPAFPLLAALPPAGTPPEWLGTLVAAPVAAAIVGVALMQRRLPAFTYEMGALRGLGAGVGAGSLTTLMVALAGGSVGPGRMSNVGADLLPVLVSATVAMGVGGLFAGVVATWWARRR